ncbi:MAG: 16S rRNA (guanine(966)-N(2))-methyltransferase RsmD [Planctomycetota bacterium]|nr:16S rRNA (guanine(966)-N(2))-methyltransferase RsmD [Planctomycetota bacterium]
MLRITGGAFRSRHLVTPEGAHLTRPMGSRTKEAIFNLLRGWFGGARVLDLYAGVGTMGLEAVSRGAAEVVLVEKDRRVLECLNANIRALQCGDRARVASIDVLSADLLHQAPKPIDIVFADPPFAAMKRRASLVRILEALNALAPVMAPKSFLVLRVPDAPTAEDPIELPLFDGPEYHGYGDEQHVLLFAPKAGVAVLPFDGNAVNKATIVDDEQDLPPLI